MAKPQRTFQLDGRETPAFCRREFLQKAGLGFGMLAAGDLLSRDMAAATMPPSTHQVHPLAPKPPHFPAKAKSVIFLFMHGGPSHIDTFDPKPMLAKLDGQKLPPSFGDEDFQFTAAENARLMASPQIFRKRGQSGVEISDLFPHLAQHADDLAVIRSCYHESFEHTIGTNWLNTGWGRIGRPSLGAWVLYGLGSESEELPAYLVMQDGPTFSGPPAYGSGFLPGVYQGTVLRSQGPPILNVKRPEQIGPKDQRQVLDMLSWFNEQHHAARPDDSELAARIASYELAFRMQMSVPELVDLSRESEATKKLYALDEEGVREFGAQCLLARRMVERGVRFVQIISGGIKGNSAGWDAHNEINQNHRVMARSVDKPIAALLADLKSRGLLESTLIIWSGEFGRTPFADGDAGGANNRNGRDHSPYGFSAWMAGGGIKGGKVIGSTDEIGLRAVEDKVHVHDLHATILGLLGLDHEKLTYFFRGRQFRLTDVGGQNNLAGRLTQG